MEVRNFLPRPRLVRGFTLVELAIVLLVIAVLLGTVLVSTGVVNKGRAQETLGMVRDLRDATRTFKERFGYFPGDFPNAQSAIPQLSGACNYSPADLASAGNGRIDHDTEVACAIDMLQAVGFLVAQPDPSNAGRFILSTSSGRVRLMHAAMSTAGAGAPPTSNVIEFERLRCEVAQAVDAKLDDGALGSGEVRGSVATCQRDTKDDPMPFLAVRLN